MPNTLRFAAPLAAFLLGCSAMTAQAGWLDFGSSSDSTGKDTKSDAQDKDAKSKDKVQPAVTLDDSIHQAQLLRLAGKYPEAIKHLSQLMMVATDDPRVVSEYGKTLAAMGRADEAVNFLTRAQQLSPGDWTVYSALGVVYDTKGDQHTADAFYDRALALKPGETSVLTNYALSRMLAKDPEGAKKLIAQVEAAGGLRDARIANNIAMIRKMAPDAPAQGVAASAPVPHPALAALSPAPTVHVTQAPLPQPRMAQNPAAPRALAPAGNVVPPQQGVTPEARDNRVVMQRVPVDPLAGPVAATHAPRPLHPRAEAEAPDPAPVKAAASTAAAKAEAPKVVPETKPAAKVADAKPAAPRVLPEAKPAAKVADAKPAAPKVLPETKPAAKIADAKAVPVKAAAKDTVPALRMSANAY